MSTPPATHHDSHHGAHHHHAASDHDHAHPSTGAGQAAGHGAVMHGPPADVLARYARAYADAQPAPGRTVVRVDLEAHELDWEFVAGRATRLWGYNAQVPGPIIEARVGDVLELHLVNNLSEPTTMHWHGLRLPAAMDGTDMVQHPIPPGGSFTYRFLLPDAGTFWYHPHNNETVQLERGLYGALIVRGDDEPVLDHERVLVLDDVKLDRDGQIAPLGGFVERHDGRQGRTLLVNGQATPVLAMAAGQVERWRIVNAASARYLRLSIGRRPFTLLGTDGGLLGAPVEASEILLPPGDRADIAVGPFNEGTTIEIESLRYVRRTIARSRTERVATVRVGGARPSQASIPATLRRIEPLVTGPVAATREVHFGVRPSLRVGVQFEINGEAQHRDRPVHVGELQVWDVVNDTLMDHPFHLHGFFFQVVSVNDERPAYLSWEDTINLPPRSRTRIAWLPDDRPGEWMYHCHILEHHEAGMMAHFVVARADETERSYR
jgi:FtsP/CotA-like multicopper oxidase with cupredoxin domain